MRTEGRPWEISILQRLRRSRLARVEPVTLPGFRWAATWTCTPPASVPKAEQGFAWCNPPCREEIGREHPLASNCAGTVYRTGRGAGAMEDATSQCGLPDRGRTASRPMPRPTTMEGGIQIAIRPGQPLACSGSPAARKLDDLGRIVAGRELLCQHRIDQDRERLARFHAQLIVSGEQPVGFLEMMAGGGTA